MTLDEFATLAASVGDGDYGPLGAELRCTPQDACQCLRVLESCQHEMNVVAEEEDLLAARMVALFVMLRPELLTFANFDLTGGKK